MGSVRNLPEQKGEQACALSAVLLIYHVCMVDTLNPCSTYIIFSNGFIGTVNAKALYSLSALNSLNMMLEKIVLSNSPQFSQLLPIRTLTNAERK